MERYVLLFIFKIIQSCIVLKIFGLTYINFKDLYLFWLRKREKLKIKVKYMIIFGNHSQFEKISIIIYDFKQLYMINI